MIRLHTSRCAARAVALTSVLMLTLGSAAVSAQAPDRTPPTAPTNLTVTGTTPYTVSLAWNPSTDNSGQFSYRICCANVSSETNIDQTATSHTYTNGLEANGTFTLSIQAVDAAGNGSGISDSGKVTFRLPKDTIPPTTPVITVTEVGPTHARLAWLAEEDGPHVWFDVYQNGIRRYAGTQNASGTFLLLTPQTTYTFTAQAHDFAWNRSAFSEPVTVTTPPANPNDKTAPTTPTNLRLAIGGTAGSESNLSWDQSTDDLDPQWLIEYDVRLNGVLISTNVGNGQLTYIPVPPGMGTFTITAVDTAGNESAPATLTYQF